MVIKLSRALICLDCETIYDQKYGINCPCCSSKTVWPVGSWLKPCVQKLNTANQVQDTALAVNKSKEVVYNG